MDRVQWNRGTDDSHYVDAQAKTAPVSDLDPIPADFWSTDYVMQDIARFSQELLEQIGRDEDASSELDPSFLDLYSRIPVCE
jgi:hypothetical protein